MILDFSPSPETSHYDSIWTRGNATLLIMPKPRKQAAPDASAPPQVGDKVYPPRSELLYEISHVYVGAQEVDLHVPGTNLERFRVRTDALTYVERKPSAKTSNPFTSAEPVFDGGELLEKIETVQRDSLKQSDDEIDILKSYLKTQRAPKAAIEALEGLTVEQHKAWKLAIGKIKKVLGE
jgi:hypothetical protein